MEKLNILIVEDESINAMFLENCLKKKNFQVAGIASSGTEAVNFVKNNEVDLILMDIMLSDEMDGITAAEIINENFSIPIVYCTAHSDDSTVIRAKATNPYGYIIKPIKKEELYSTIEIAMHKFLIDKELIEREKELDLRNRINNIFLTAIDDDIFKKISELVSKVMRSKYVYFGFLDENEDMVFPKIDENILSNCHKIDGVHIIKREDWSNGLNEIIINKKNIIINKSSEITDVSTTVKNAFYHPIIFQKKAIGCFLTFDNLSNYSNNDKRILGIICDHISPILNARLGKQREEKLKFLFQSRLDILWGLAKLQDEPLKVLSDYILENIKNITESAYGFYGFMNEDESIMSIYSWTKETMSDCKMSDKPIEYPISKAGIWAECIKQRKSIIINDYENVKKKLGLPEGHVPIKRFISIPIFHNNKIVSVAAVANKKIEYTMEDQNTLENFLDNAQIIVNYNKLLIK